jgi:Domain of unknown function (DUF4382)
MRSGHILALALACGVLTGACGNSPTAPSGANLTVLLKDSPATDAKAIFVTFSDVSVHRADGTWEPLDFAGGATTRTCDLKQLTASTDVLGAGALSAGHYTQIRLTVSAATLFFDNAATGPACAPSLPPPVGASATLTIPSGDVKLNREFDVGSSGATMITLDFDAEQSIVLAGSVYLMNPVITVVSVQ